MLPGGNRCSFPVERSRSVEKAAELFPFFVAPSTTDSRCPSVPTTRKTESRISSFTTSVEYRVDSVETQNNALAALFRAPKRGFDL